MKHDRAGGGMEDAPTEDTRPEEDDACHAYTRTSSDEILEPSISSGMRLGRLRAAQLPQCNHPRVLSLMTFTIMMQPMPCDCAGQGGFLAGRAKPVNPALA
ncbi:hypothetical protein JDV02_000655 [Purpureocillium takamizusanense]|uniref:Uncharacterized protein n=1 Tax=Purpureocillium takamizusanense TaxID=2060973 RepID=A0A9Q8V5P8_9HYPO|nr:uncharacterized protein JDV02_000655 [Purpureocillium takamizusanense]UNI13970.1 hypothetical protein JDV02_000655 [Purpureocillium takamizusanense]